MAHDPVCGMEIKDISKAEKLEYKGITYYFCTSLCKIQFEEDPEKYAKKNYGGEHRHHQ
ncbi:MAG: YHS domain-containing protein [Bacteroidota bacterium]|nr:YHS domain-containing protein [Bacteroidota bacterium]